MNRSYVAMLGATAVIGGLAGGVAAVRAEQAAPAPGLSASRSASPSPARSTDGQVLWSTPSSIHDGDRVIDLIDMPDAVDRVWRVRDGYLVTQVTSPGQPAVGIHRVAPGGLTELITFVLGEPDVDSSGTRVAGLDSESGTYRIWDVATGRVEQTVEGDAIEDATPAPGVAFTPDGLLTEWIPQGGGGRYLVLTRRDDSSAIVEIRPGSWDASPTADLFVGTERDPDPDDPVIGPLPCLVTSTVGGTDTGGRVRRNCNLRVYGDRAIFDPSGQRTLAVPALTDGFGPGAFSVVDVRTGRLLGRVNAPDWTFDGVFLDAETLLLRGAFNGSGNGTVLYRCPLDDACQEIERTEATAHLGVTG